MPVHCGTQDVPGQPTSPSQVTFQVGHRLSFRLASAGEIYDIIDLLYHKTMILYYSHSLSLGVTGATLTVNAARRQVSGFVLSELR